METHSMFLEEDLILLKMSYSKWPTESTQSLSKFQQPCLQNDNINFQIHMELQGEPEQSWKRTGSDRLTLPDFKIYYKTILIKTMWYWHKDRFPRPPPKKTQWTRIRSLAINPFIYGQLIFYEGSKFSQWRKILSSTNGIGTARFSHATE